MKLTDTDIGQFRMLWKQATGQDISDEIAREHAENIVGLVALATEPLTKPREEKPP